MNVYFSRQQSRQPHTLYSELGRICANDVFFCHLVATDMIKFTTDQTVLLTHNDANTRAPLRAAIEAYLALHNTALMLTSRLDSTIEDTERSFCGTLIAGVQLILEVLKKFEFNPTHIGHKHVLMLMVQLASLHAVEHINLDRKKARQFRERRVDILRELFTLFDSVALASSK